MKCPACSNEMVKARATNFGEEYDFCRACRKELSPAPKPCHDPYAQEFVGPDSVCGLCHDEECGVSGVCNGRIATMPSRTISNKIARLTRVHSMQAAGKNACFYNGVRDVHVLPAAALKCACHIYDSDGKARVLGIATTQICVARLSGSCCCYECDPKTPHPLKPSPVDPSKSGLSSPGDEKVVKAMRFAELYSVVPRLLEQSEKRLVGMSPALTFDYAVLEARVAAHSTNKAIQATDRCDRCRSITGDVLYRRLKQKHLCDWCDSG